jgi:hypothetical protein
MKHLLLAGTAVLAVSSALAGPIQKQHVPADAKWVIHLDVDALLATPLGEFLGREILDRKLAKPRADLKLHFDVDFDWRKIQSLTLFGTDFQAKPDTEGVLVVRSRLDIAGELDKAIDRLAGYFADGQAPLKQTQSEPFPLYATKDNVYGTPMGEDLFLLSKSREQLEKARAVVTAKAPSLGSARTMPALTGTPKGFLVLAVADTSGADAALPPKAKALKNAQGGQLVAGQRDDRLFLNLALNARDTESAAQLQQAVQGLIAIATLTQPDNKDLQQLVQAAKVAGTDKTVTLNVSLPMADVLAKVTARHKQEEK